MSVGSLTLRVVPDHPRQSYYGDDPVTGSVIVGWMPSPKMAASKQELFGPLNVTLSFHGRAKTKVWKSNGKFLVAGAQAFLDADRVEGNSSTIYRGRKQLFAFSKSIYNGPIRIAQEQRQTFRFTLHFPQQCHSTPANFERDLRFNVDPDQPLPPTFAMAYQGFANHFESFTAYRIGASASMPQIDIEPASIHKDAEISLQYGPPRMPLSVLERTLQNQVDNRRSIMLQNENLVPESERASGFKQKTKALFKSDYYPQYNFTVITKGPKSVFLHQPIAFELRIVPDGTPAVGVVVPEVRLASWSVKIDASTQVRAEKAIFSYPESQGSETVFQFTGPLKTPIAFSKANEWTGQAITKPVVGIPCSFATFNINRTYSIKAKFEITAAKKHFSIDYQWPITVYPPLAQANSAVEAGPAEDEPVVVAGSSAAPEEPIDAPPPAYNLAVKAVAS